MNISSFSILVTICCLVSNLAHANPMDSFRDAQRIVVITENEGIHYAQFCGFYEFRELLAASVGNVSAAVKITDSPLFEVRVLGTAGESTAYIGDHWVGTAYGAALLPSATYDRLVQLVSKRKGQGVAKAKIDTSIQRALDKIQDPAYIEQNLCAGQ